MFFKTKIQEIDGEPVILFPDEVIKQYSLEEGEKLVVEAIDNKHLLIGISGKKR